MTKAKKKVPVELRPATTKADQMNRLIDSMDTYTKHRIDCCICGEEDKTQDTTEARYARELFEEGWRYGVSEKFQVEGAMCPECARTPDEKRGKNDPRADTLSSTVRAENTVKTTQIALVEPIKIAITPYRKPFMG